jgi:hypothetical protein
MSTRNEPAARRLGDDVVHTLAGLADLALGQVEHTVRLVRSGLARADLGELVREGNNELKARGELTVRRYQPMAEPHLEHLARRAARRIDNADA